MGAGLRGARNKPCAVSVSWRRCTRRTMFEAIGRNGRARCRGARQVQTSRRPKPPQNAIIRGSLLRRRGLDWPTREFAMGALAWARAPETLAQCRALQQSSTRCQRERHSTSWKVPHHRERLWVVRLSTSATSDRPVNKWAANQSPVPAREVANLLGLRCIATARRDQIRGCNCGDETQARPNHKRLFQQREAVLLAPKNQ